jgi:transcriptional regulator with XRE-family HTH domain
MAQEKTRKEPLPYEDLPDEKRELPPNEQLAEFRSLNELTQADLSEALGCSVAHLCAVERGKYPPQHRRILESMHRVVGIPPAAWFEN